MASRPPTLESPRSVIRSTEVLHLLESPRSVIRSNQALAGPESPRSVIRSVRAASDQVATQCHPLFGTHQVPTPLDMCLKSCLQGSLLSTDLDFVRDRIAYAQPDLPAPAGVIRCFKACFIGIISSFITVICLFRLTFASQMAFYRLHEPVSARFPAPGCPSGCYTSSIRSRGPRIASMSSCTAFARPFAVTKTKHWEDSSDSEAH